ncbi:MAG TPA: DUF6794 domain-containing protein [Steroidobacteraceae bacterium]|nr:DUF6794 domain-containing protein [Steroidobacteraceae bacterium]
MLPRCLLLLVIIAWVAGARLVAAQPAAAVVPIEGNVPSENAIPRSLDEALRKLQATMPAQQTEAIRAGNTSPAWWDRVVGPRVLKSWVEPPNSPLTAYFRELGIDHPQDISGILRHAFYLYLNHRLTPRDLQMELTFRKGYWERLLTPDEAAAAQRLSAQAETDPALTQRAYVLDAKLVSDDLLDTLSHPALSVPLELQEWRLMNQWISQQGAKLGAADAGGYERIVAALDPTIRVDATDLQPGTTLISIDQGEIGHVLVVGTAPGKPPRIWRIDAGPSAQGPDAAALLCWRPKAGVRPCAPQIIGVLPPDAHGLPRFYVQAVYAQSGGATRDSQLSVWRWDGRTATPIYVTSFATGGDAEGQGVSVDGDTLRIGTKSEFKALWSCGSCDGRQIARRLRLLPDDHVDDLGTMSLVPELDVIDEVYSDIRDGRASEELVSAPARSFMERTWLPMIAAKAQGLFINTPPTITHSGDRTFVCFHANYDTDRSMHPILFTMDSRDGRLRILSAQQDAPNCSADKWEEQRMRVP